VVPSLIGLAPFQIAFVVRDLERAAREFEARLSAGPWRGWLFGPQGQGREYCGHPAEWTVRLVLNFGAAGDGAAAYYDTADALGFLVEAVEPLTQMPPTDFTV
jgi:hypothetical protein